MAYSHNLKITLSDAALKFVRSKVSSGEYASESEVVLEGLEALRQESDERKALASASQAEVEHWIREVGAPRYDSAHADPSSLIPLEQLEKRLEERRLERSKVPA